MNERLRELYRQAHSIRHYDGNPALDGNPPTVYWQGEVSAERFAQLIVQECIRTIQMGISRDGHNTEKYLRSMKHIKQIKQHFGVE